MNQSQIVKTLLLMAYLLILVPQLVFSLGLGSFDSTIPHVRLGIIGLSSGDLSSSGFTMQGNIDMNEYNITNVGYLDFSNTIYTGLIYLDAQGNIHIGGN